MRCVNGHEVPNDTNSTLPNDCGPCPVCGTHDRIISITLHDNIGMQDQLRGKARHDAQRKPYQEIVSGEEIFRQTGDVRNVQRNIDHDQDRYDETITDKKSGEVIRECHEPLKDHQNRGSARKDHVKKEPS